MHKHIFLRVCSNACATFNSIPIITHLTHLRVQLSRRSVFIKGSSRLQWLTTCPTSASWVVKRQQTASTSGHKVLSNSNLLPFLLVSHFMNPFLNRILLFFSLSSQPGLPRFLPPSSFSFSLPQFYMEKHSWCSTQLQWNLVLIFSALNW